MAEENQERLITWIRFGIELEDKGLRFYKECLANVRNARAMELFDFLVKVETSHKAVLTNMLEAVTRGDRKRIDESIRSFMKLDVKAPLFEKQALEKMTKPDAQLTEMFNTALGFEQQGMEFYTEMAGRELDPEVKRLFAKLAADETLHKKEIIDLGYFVFGVPPPDDYL